ncbi:MAG TPA: hypothetical protein VNM40_01140 [Candidatus Paceibacterota bacterium]|nr:hypothetical protein [Candidatus Paceibacterota bacterium]
MPDARARYALLIAGIVAGNIVLGGFVKGEGQLFPFFSWSLLSHVPQSSVHIRLLVHTGDSAGEDLQSIVEAQGAEFPIDTYNLVKDMGEAYLQRRSDFPELRTRVERAYLQPGVTYSLVREERVLPSGALIHSQTIDTFVATDHDR